MEIHTSPTKIGQHWPADGLDNVVHFLRGWGVTVAGGEHQVDGVKQPRQWPGQVGIFELRKSLTKSFLWTEKSNTLKQRLKILHDTKQNNLSEIQRKK